MMNIQIHHRKRQGISKRQIRKFINMIIKIVFLIVKVLSMQLKSKPREEPEQKKLGRQNPSRVRDHLANERTYLAWMRTAIALLGFGVVIVRLRLFQSPLIPNSGNGWKLGLVFSLVGLITVWFSTAHYFSVRRDIEEDTYEPTNRWVILFSLAVMMLGTGVVYFVFTTPLNSFSQMVID